MAKRGPKPKFGETRDRVVALRFTNEQLMELQRVAGGGTADAMAKWVLERVMAEAQPKPDLLRDAAQRGIVIQGVNVDPPEK